MIPAKFLSRRLLPMARLLYASAPSISALANTTKPFYRNERGICGGETRSAFVSQVKSSSHKILQDSNTSIKTAVSDDAMLKIGWSDDLTDLFPYIWLRDNCLCSECFNPQTLSRKIKIQDLQRDIRPVTVKVTGEGQSVEMKWSDGHFSAFQASWLHQRAFNTNRQKQRLQEIYLEKILWNSESLKDLPKTSFQDLLESDEALLKFLQQLEQLGLILVKNTPAETGQIERLTERIGHLKRTHYGTTFTVKTKAEPNNLAYTSDSLNLHTDQPYLDDMPGIQLLHCISQFEGEGGDNLLVDGFHVAKVLKESDPQKYKILTDTVVDFIDIGEEDGKAYRMINREPTIVLGYDGEVKNVNLSHMAHDSYFLCPPDVVGPWYDAMISYHELLSDPRHCISYKLVNGDIVVFDNNRVLHGRLGYRMTGHERHLEGGYWDWNEVRSLRRVLLEKQMK